MSLWFLGDVHGRFGHIEVALRAAQARGEAVAGLVFLGDIEAPQPFETCIRPLQDRLGHDEIFFIIGNHDSDHTASWLHLQDSPHRNLDGRVVDIGGLKVAGLSGIFRGEIWNPDSTHMADGLPRFANYAAFSDALRERQPTRLRATLSPVQHGKLRKHATSIFPDTVAALSARRADILVTHEAPGMHPHGFETISALARTLQVRASFHGHQHDNLPYSPQGRWQAHGVGLRGISDENGRVIVAGELDAQRAGRTCG